jgi:hypothetical protein
LPESCHIQKAGRKQTLFHKGKEWSVAKSLKQFASSLNLCQTIKKIQCRRLLVSRRKSIFEHGEKCIYQ